MSTATEVRTIPGHYRLKNVVRSETAKMLTLRSTAALLSVTVAIAILVTVLNAHAQLHHSAPYYFGFDPTQESLSGMIVAGLTAGVFGTLLISGEYSSGTIRQTLAATPRRPLLLGAKVGVAAASALLFSEILSFVCFFLGQAIMSGGGAPSATLASPHAFRAVALTGVFVALLALMAFGFGLLLRSTAGALAAFVGVVFVLQLVMHGISEGDARYVPTNILITSIMATVKTTGDRYPPLGTGLGLFVMALYAGVALVAGAVLFVRRDA